MSEGPRSESDDLRDLAQRLLSHQHQEGQVSVELFVLRLPDVWGAVPEPPGADLLGGAVRSRRGLPTQVEAIYESEGDARSVLSRYEAALGKGGWAVFQGSGGMQGGFVPGRLGAGQSYRQGDQGPILMVAATDGGTNLTELRLRLDWDMARHLPEMRMRGRPEGAERLPPLSPPAGVPLRVGGGGGSSGSWHAQATVGTDLPVPDLETHFSRRLEQAGWTRLAGTADDVAAWSSWNLPGEGGWRGILLVLAAFKPDERFLYVRVAATDSGENGGYSTGLMSLGS